MRQIVERFPIRYDAAPDGPYALYRNATLLFTDDGLVHWLRHAESESCDTPGCYVCSMRYAESVE